MKKFNILVIVLASAILGCSHVSKQEQTANTVQFSRGKVSIEIEIILPESYKAPTAAHYPVIYVLDGYWNKNSVKDAYNALRFDNIIPEAIIVSIGYPSAIRDYENQRMWDLTPAYDGGFKAGGNAAELLNIVAQDMVPFVQSQYRTDRNRSVLIGHSLAGLFTLYTLYERANIFTHYAAISPSALWAKNTLAQIDKNYAKKSKSLNASLYLTYETDEYQPYVLALKRYVDQLKSIGYDGLALTIAQVQGMGHVSMKAEGYMRGIAWSFADIKPKGPSEFEKKNIHALKNLTPNPE